MKPVINEPFLKLSTQRALLGAISPQILGICIQLIKDNFVMTVYAQGNISEEQRYELSSAVELIEADTYPELTYGELILAENAKSPLITRGAWVFLQMGCTTRND